MGVDVDITAVRKGEGPLVFWVSRHGPLPAEIEELERLLGDPHIVKVSGRIPNADWLVLMINEFVKKTPIERGKRVIVVPVLPLSMIKYIVEAFSGREGVEVWWADMETQYYSAEEPEVDPKNEVKLFDGVRWRVLRFRMFRRIKEIRMVTEPVTVTRPMKPKSK